MLGDDDSRRKGKKEHYSTMAAVISVFSPSIDEQRWVNQSRRALDSELILQIDDFTPTIFQVPKSLKESKPEAYTPRLLGLGPYHHLRPDLHAADRQKLAEVNKFLTKNSSTKSFFSDDFLKKMKDLDPVVRANYDQYLDLQSSTLDHILSVDSFYLLHFLGAYDQKTDAANLESGRRELAGDVMMLENQIPAIAVAEMGKEIDLFSPERGTQETMLHSQLFYYCCKAHSPLKPSELWRDRRHQSSHLLAHMYHLVLNNRGYEEKSDLDLRMRRSRITEVGTEALTALSEVGLGGGASIWIKPLLFAFKSLQAWENTKLADELISNDNKTTGSRTQKILHQIPSASVLSKKHSVEFRLLEREGIKDIKLDFEDGKPVLYLPEITFEHESEVVLRNLVAYESAISTQDSTLELAEYVHLMGELLQKAEDMVILRDRGIVKGNQDDKQVVEIFNAIRNSVGKSIEESASQKAEKELKEMVEKWERGKKDVWKRGFKFVEKKAKNGMEFMRKPLGIGLKYLLYVFMVILLVLQMMQAYCQVYGCNKGPSEGNTLRSLLLHSA
ncbi:unnamed protein product [Cuscuta campestris]|uniref:Uncharacterized protein n=1 Tax=Cuscuta campestris TaxID=132261 RepID=A0A484KCZ7_9ASTE|nr:unnamed protein product [Cuscuta campestris]